MPVPNVAVIQDALDDITTHLEKWNQAEWAINHDINASWGDKVVAMPLSCGTSLCLAGNVIDRSEDWAMVSRDGGRTAYVVVPAAQLEKEVERLQAATVAYDGWWAVEDKPRRLPDVAAELMGLDNDQANLLFHEHNSLADLWAWAWLFTGGALKLPEQGLPSYNGVHVNVYDKPLASLVAYIGDHNNRVVNGEWDEDDEDGYAVDATEPELIQRAAERLRGLLVPA